jgi:L-ascorbate metabolism protein UlaG (beta-lactamase superfamily)
MFIEVVYHSCISISVGNASLITDPYAGSRLKSSQALARVKQIQSLVKAADLVILSNHLPDHYQPEILADVNFKGWILAKNERMVLDMEDLGKKAYEVKVNHYYSTPLGQLIPIQLPFSKGQENIGFILETNDGCSIFYAGDCYFDEIFFGEIGTKFSINLAILPMSGTKQFGKKLTMDAQEALKAAELLKANAVLPIHLNDKTIALIRTSSSEIDPTIFDNSRVHLYQGSANIDCSQFKYRGPSEAAIAAYYSKDETAPEITNNDFENDLDLDEEE